jgi:DHA2 family methylenomycin A resistance protein-like MFS transporter
MVLAAVCFGTFIALLDATSVSVALPNLQRELDLSTRETAWVANSYNLVFASLLLITAVLGDRFGHKRVFLTGTISYAAGGAVVCLSGRFEGVLAGRAIQGLGGAMLVPASLALLTHSFRGPRERARALGVWISTGGAAALVGPVISGVMVDAFGWRGSFLIAGPFVALSISLTLRFVTETPTRTPRPIDVPGQVIGVGLLAAACLLAFQLSSWPPLALAVGTGAVLSLGLAFVVAERSSKAPLVPVELLRHGTARQGLVLTTIHTCAGYGVLFVVSVHLQRGLGYSATETGGLLVPMAAMVMVASLSAGRLLPAVGPRVVVAVGLTLNSAGTALLITMSKGAWVVLVAGCFIGLGAMTMTGLGAAVLDSADDYNAGVLSGLISLSRQVGVVLGVALASTLYSIDSQPTLPLGVATTMLATGAVIALCSMPRSAGGARPLTPTICREPDGPGLYVTPPSS